MVFGRIAHEMIEASANGDDPQKILTNYEKNIGKVFSSERDAYMEIINDVDLLMDGYFNYYAKDKIKFVAIKGKLAEHEFEVPLTKGINIKGKIDAINRTSDSRVWLTEHKSHKEIPTEDVRFRDLQTVIYASILPTLGIKTVDGVLWDYIRTKPPTIPGLLKSGELSRAKIDTLPSVYRTEIKRNKLKESDYKEILKSLENNERNFYRRVYMPMNIKLSNQLLSEVIITAKEIQEKGGIDCTRNITKDCSWCEFESLCRAELTGMDADFIRKKEFQVKKEEEKGNELNG